MTPEKAHQLQHELEGLRMIKDEGTHRLAVILAAVIDDITEDDDTTRLHGDTAGYDSETEAGSTSVS